MDSLCISFVDKTETQEAIKDIFDWYDKAAKHFIYLEDVDGQQSPVFSETYPTQFQRSWFLRELLANSPQSTVFLDKHWKYLGDRETLFPAISQMMRIQPEHLVDFRKACVATRLSWGAWLNTAIPEDTIYAMLDIVGVSIQHIYGEGEVKAFRRLHEAFIDSNNDECILAWHVGPLQDGSRAGLLAPSVNFFLRCKDMQKEEGERRFSLRRDGNGRTQGVELNMPVYSSGKTATVTLRCSFYEPLSSRKSLALSLRLTNAGSWCKHSTFGIEDERAPQKTSKFRVKKEAKVETLFVPHDP